jgi:two-component system, NarL family, response regulator DesR
MIRVLVAEGDDLVGLALSALLALEKDLAVVARAADGPAAVAAAVASSPDVALVDLGLPGLDGFEVAAELAAAVPACAVVLTGRPDLRQALSSPVKGFLPRGQPGGAVAEVIRRVHAGGRYVDPALAADALITPACPLTPRELEVLRLAGYDTPVPSIARVLKLSDGTVRNYLSAAVTKLRATGRQDAYRTARDRGWL